MHHQRKSKNKIGLPNNHFLISFHPQNKKKKGNKIAWQQ
jgi:hypothetical protein